MDDAKTFEVDGSARCKDGPTAQSLLKADSWPVDEVLLEENYTYIGSKDIPVERYLSKDWLDQEVEHVWKKVWQIAGREEEIPNVGDFFIYDIVDLSLIVIRTEPGTIRAYHNFCLHRGRKLKTAAGNAKEIKCAFHGFTWEIGGNIKDVPCRWDFQHLSDHDLALREAKVGTWGGFVFVTMDAQSETLETYLGKLPDHFKNWALEDRYTTAYVRRRIACNWKVALEAFIEGYHTTVTHPQLAGYLADANSQYDNYVGENFNRMINPTGVQSPLLPPMSQEEVVQAMLGVSSNITADGFALPEGATARAFLAEQMRKVSTAGTGVDHSQHSDAEMLDTIQYLIYPNFSPWGGFWPYQLCYVFRPDGRDPDSCLLDVRLLRRYDPSAPRPKAARLRILADDQKWGDAEELRATGPVFDQDMQNLPLVQQGMKASVATKNAISLANYQESRIRDFHNWLEGRIPSSREKSVGSASGGI